MHVPSVFIDIVFPPLILSLHLNTTLYVLSFDDSLLTYIPLWYSEIYARAFAEYKDEIRRLIINIKSAREKAPIISLSAMFSADVRKKSVKKREKREKINMKR